jgi:hypothetical protein
MRTAVDRKAQSVLLDSTLSMNADSVYVYTALCCLCVQRSTEARTENLRRELVAARLTAECWDSMVVHPRQVRAMQRSGAAAENFAIRK